MTPDRWERLKPFFQAAVERPSADRPAFIAAIDAEDEIRRELGQLVDAYESRGSTRDPIVQALQARIPTAVQTLKSGDVLLGRFKIVRPIGSGGMGDVYEAIDQELNQTVALKTIRPEIADSLSSFTCFKKEVLLARRVSGPNVCRIYELFRVERGTEPSKGVFISMEFLDGVTLADQLEQTGPIPWREAQTIALDICSGLAAVHDAGIVHRDLKSRNIMLVGKRGAERAVVMDFGLAREAAPAVGENSTSVTVSGAFLGTPQYMAPEQFEGKEVSTAGHPIFLCHLVERQPLSLLPEICRRSLPSFTSRSPEGRRRWLSG